ncbi:MAG TPA: thioredoxin domain-containing protein [Polyangiaceae bacterium]|nr:thioredoxin domain-containing protein [Polyangiaceae bacterium]
MPWRNGGAPAGCLRAIRPASVLVLLAAVGCSGRGCARSSPASTSEASSAVGDAELKARLEKALRAKGPSYAPRTRHKHADGTPQYTNRLILETSPYLLQHAHNPVNWFPWGEAAFERATELRRPIFLSVGYSTCHWCHVMEEESFEDEEIARYLNDHYVAIKVDREERPDVDAVYMTFVQSFGSGGWPMSVWLTPKREPFLGGTYFPPRAGVRGAKRGFLDLLREQAEGFAADPSGLAETARALLRRVQAASAPEPAGDFPPASVLRVARAQSAQRFDPAFGGARGAPKFPSSFPVRFLLRFARRGSDAEARQMAITTLERMRAGGIYDQVGGGFHRYATDAGWVVPHFEKMLYDNALLAEVYLEAARATGDARLRNTARETLDYLLREMQSEQGTFYSATDADSSTEMGRREEGIFFTWTPNELRTALGDDDARLAAAWFGVTDAGNFEGRSILSTPRPLEEVARQLALEPRLVLDRFPTIRSRLLATRSQRPPPLRDDKVIVAWNGLALSALARAAIVLGDRTYEQAAIRTARALVAPLRAGRRLPHVFVDGREQEKGFADDHVLLAHALLDVFELTADPDWLADATGLMEEMERSFADPTHGGYFLSAEQHETLLLRGKPDYDGPIPSVNSVAALTWLRLYAYADEERFRQRAETTVRAFARTLQDRPLALEHMLLALDWATDTVKEIVIVTPEGRGALAPSARPLLDVLQRTFAPNAVLVVATAADLAGTMARSIPWARDKPLRGGGATAYVCNRGACKLPTNDPKVFAAQLAETTAYP